MAVKFREKAKAFRKGLMRFFCLCSAAAPMEEDGKVEGRLRFAMRSDIDVPAQSENVERKAEIASILEEVIGGPSTSSVQDARSMSEFIERRLNIKRSDIPVFQPSAATSAHSIPLPPISVTRQHLTSVPHQQSLPSDSLPRQQVTSVPHQRAPASVSMPCQNVERNAEIASILEEMTGPAPSGSIQEVREMYEFIERALTFRRRDLPVFQPPQNPTLPPPLFTPRFTPGAVFEPNRVFSTHGFPSGRALA